MRRVRCLQRDGDLDVLLSEARQEGYSVHDHRYYNHDGKLDVGITGLADTGFFVSALWRNIGNSTFADTSMTPAQDR